MPTVYDCKPSDFTESPLWDWQVLRTQIYFLAPLADAAVTCKRHLGTAD